MPTLFELHQEASIANHFIAELRDQKIQKDSQRFRKNLEKLGEVLAYEVSKSLPFQAQSVQSSLGSSETLLMPTMPVLASILRAALPMYQGFLNFFDKAESAFVGAYRGPMNEDNSFDIVQGYTVTPDLNEKILIMIDPMLATGRSLYSVYESLKFYGTPQHLHLVSAIASQAGVQYIQDRLPQAHIWTGVIDPELNDKSYIIPGLGDAGDLAFGIKE